MKQQIEITRSNVTLSQFFAYVKAQCEKKGLDFVIDRESFENPDSISNVSATLKDGIKYFTDFAYNNGKTVECGSVDTDCVNEIYRVKPLEYQCYFLHSDGTMWNEICEFTFEDERYGTGYYYQASVNN